MIIRYTRSYCCVICIQDIGKAEKSALKIVSYIGCIISILCLALTVILFLAQGYII